MVRASFPVRDVADLQMTSGYDPSLSTLKVLFLYLHQGIHV